MGKISLNVKSKKADDVKGLMKHRENSPSPTKTAPVVSQHPSPTPKHPLTETKAGCCRRACLFSLGMLVVLILFVSTACLVDYQQGNLATHTSQLPKEVREFPSKVGKYAVEVLYQTPKDLHRIFNVALNWTRKNDSGPTSKIIIGSQRLAITDEILLDQTEGELSSLYEEGKDDTVVVDGLEGVAQFFVGILNDVASMFAATTEEELKDSGSQPNVEITNNAIDRKVDEEESSESFEMTQPGVINIDDSHADQVHSPRFFEHTTENEDDWNDEVIKVMEEIYPEGGLTQISSYEETLKNLLNGEGNEKQHTH